MKLSIQYAGQIANLLGTSHETMEIEPGARLQQVVDHILARHGPVAAPFFRDPRGGLPPTLLVIFDGEQVRGDLPSREVTGVRDLMFMSPMAGG